MNLKLSGSCHQLNLTLEDAFQLQEALATAIHRVTTLTTENALRGAKVTRYAAGEGAGSLTYEQNGQVRPGSLHIAVIVGE